jgi:multidrug efflux pump subunit AcrA (membrane-fusion protein)
LLAVSGVDRPDRRSRTVRGLEKLAAISARLGDPLYLADDEEEALPQAAEALHHYADIANARQVAVVPMRVAGGDNSGEDPSSEDIVGVLVAESFEGYAATVARDRVTEAARVCAPALRNAIEVDSTPMLGLVRSARGLKRPSTLFKGLLAAALLAGGVAALVFVPAELRIEARGELQPVVRRNVFAPGDGIVERVAVQHGQQVKRGELLATLRDPQLDLEIKRIDGERQTTLRQLDAVRATRTSLDRREASATEAYRLSAEEQQMKQRLTALDEQHALLVAQRDELRIESPLDGMVVTWELDETLLGRPVQRGEVLLSVADTRSDWRVELELPDDRIGYVLDAQVKADSQALAVEYRLGSQEEGFSKGVIQRIAQRAEESDPQAAPGAMRTVLVYVTPDEPVVEGAREGEVRPGASVRARVHCGQRSLGYVWMHDLINAARVWWEF